MADELLKDIEACQKLLLHQEKENPKYDMTNVREMQAKSLFARLQKVHLSPAEATAFVAVNSKNAATWVELLLLNLML